VTLRSKDHLDDVDWRILDELQRDGRLSFNELGRRISLSPPAVAERVRRLEATGVITGYRAVVDPAQAGQSLAAFVEMRCHNDRCLLKTSTADDFPEIVEIHKLSGDHCVMLRVRAGSIQHLESFGRALHPVRGQARLGARGRQPRRDGVRGVVAPVRRPAARR
jgi:Lrp/AsnC family leucine-responsive transcriptional regulator